MSFVATVKQFLVGDDRPMWIEVRHMGDGQVVLDLASSQGKLRLDLPPAGALELALAIKQAAEAAQATLAENASRASEMHHRR
jgi:hypothetical protein